MTTAKRDAPRRRFAFGHAVHLRVAAPRVGTHGAAATSVFDRSIKRWQFDVTHNRFTSQLVEEITWPKEEDHFYFHNTTDQTRDIIGRVAAGDRPRFPARDAYKTMELVFAAEQSANSGQPVRLPTTQAGS